MNPEEILGDKALSAKAKTELLSSLLLEGKVTVDELITAAVQSKDKEKATCIEAFEFATKQDTSVATEKLLNFVTTTLKEDAPRIKWESAKVIGNIAHVFPAKLGKTVPQLLENSEHHGPVVRWATAFALCEIAKLGTKLNKRLIPAIEATMNRELNNGVRKQYAAILKKLAA